MYICWYIQITPTDFTLKVMLIHSLYNIFIYFLIFFLLICSVYKAALSPCTSSHFPRGFIKYWCHIYHFPILGISGDFKQLGTVWSFQTILGLSEAELTHGLVAGFHLVFCCIAVGNFRGKAVPHCRLSTSPSCRWAHLSFVSIAFKSRTFLNC